MNRTKITHRFFAALLFIAAPPVALSVVAQHKAGNNDFAWSSPVNGVQARLSFAKNEKMNGTPLIATYLDIRNVSDLGSVIELPFNMDTLQFEVVDEQNNKLPRGPTPYDEVFVEVGMLRLPHDSCLHFNISHRGAGIPKNQAALLDLGAPYTWVFSPVDKHTYYLRARLSVDPFKSGWSGKIEIPKVKIPTTR